MDGCESREKKLRVMGVKKCERDANYGYDGLTFRVKQDMIINLYLQS